MTDEIQIKTYASQIPMSKGLLRMDDGRFVIKFPDENPFLWGGSSGESAREAWFLAFPGLDAADVELRKLLDNFPSGAWACFGSGPEGQTFAVGSTKAGYAAFAAMSPTLPLALAEAFAMHESYN